MQSLITVDQRCKGLQRWFLMSFYYSIHATLNAIYEVESYSNLCARVRECACLAF